MAKRSSRKSEKQLVSVHLVGWYLNALKGVSDRFRGTARELGREAHPKRLHSEHLQAIGALITDFSIWFQPELFVAPRLHSEWRDVLDVAQQCQKNLKDQFCSLSGLSPDDNASEYDSRYKIASAVLVPLADDLRNTLLAI